MLNWQRTKVSSYFSLSVLHSKTPLQRKVTQKTRLMKMKMDNPPHSRKGSAIHSSRSDTKAIGLTLFEATILESLTTTQTIKSSTMPPSARYLRRKGRSSNRSRYYHLISSDNRHQTHIYICRQVMLHDQDTKMVLMNPTDPNSLYSMDIERGKVVEEWKVHDNITVDHVAPNNKFAQTTREQTLVGASHNAIFRVDPRVSGTKLVDSQYKQYAGKNKFSGVATTASGKLAVASEKGDIRLFDTIGKNAKTALPPLGDPIIGIDVTASGRYIVATTKSYLLLIDTLIGEGRYQGSLGFDRSFPAAAKPMPKRLQLRSEHVAYMNHDVSFSPARYVISISCIRFGAL
jgi:hypothetical protein